jgi:carboxypeptidase family protein
LTGSGTTIWRASSSGPKFVIQITKVGFGPKACRRCNILPVRVLALIPAVLTLGLAPTSQARSQQPQTPPGSPSGGNTATAVGVVFDSVRLRPLSGAVIRVDSSQLAATADSEGRFRIEGITPGMHYLRVEHVMLDTLGITLRSPPEQYVAGETSTGELATPSPERLIELLCSAAWRARGPAALMGRVREADTGNPATGAKVSLVWYEVEISGGVRRAPRVREATVAADGTYRICGLPEKLDGRVQVLRGTLTSGEIAMVFGQDLLGLRSMSIAPPGQAVAVSVTSSDSTRKPTRRVLGNAKLTGKIVNRSGQPLVGARVSIEGTDRVALSRAGGDFVLDSLPVGTQTVTARLLGYAPTEVPVELSTREPRAVTVRMEVFVPVLEAVRVTAQRERALDDVGFARRKRGGAGWFMEGDAIAQRNAQQFTDLMRSAPGIRVSQSNGQQILESSRDPMSGCVNVWLDGSMWQQMTPGDIDGFVKPYELGALEVYSPTTTPAEYQQAGRSCTTIIAWTTRRLDRKKR